MGAGDADELTAEDLVEVLAAAGELDAGVEVLDTLRLRDPNAPALGRLRARLFAAEELPIERKRQVLAALDWQSLAMLARQGALFACAAACRALAGVFPEETSWAVRQAQIESLLAPLPNPRGDPARTAADALLACGATHEALAALRELLRSHPGEAEIERRVEALRALLFQPAHTRPYRPMSHEDAARALAGGGSEDPPGAAGTALLVERAQSYLEGGNLQEALVDVGTLAQRSPGSHRWIRLRDALQRLVAGQVESPEASPTQAITLRLSPVTAVDLWLSRGMLREARDEARGFLSTVASSEVAAALSQRLADLDVVLGGAFPTPVPHPVADAFADDEEPTAETEAPDVTLARRKIVRLE